MGGGLGVGPTGERLGQHGGLGQQVEEGLANGVGFVQLGEEGLANMDEDWANSRGLGQWEGGFGQRGEGGISNRKEYWANMEEERLAYGRRRDWAIGGGVGGMYTQGVEGLCKQGHRGEIGQQGGGGGLKLAI